MSYYHSDPDREKDEYAIPDVEVFHIDKTEMLSWLNTEGSTWAEMFDPCCDDSKEDSANRLSGWYYQTCLPGCMPDSDPFGPYETEEKAVSAMRD